MLGIDADAVMCDMAETYHVFDIYSLPAPVAARLACGLRETSRIKSRMAGLNVSLDTFLLALSADALRLLVWFKTKDGQKSRNRPVSFAERMYIREEHKDENLMSFETADEYEAMRQQLLANAPKE